MTFLIAIWTVIGVIYLCAMLTSFAAIAWMLTRDARRKKNEPK